MIVGTAGHIDHGKSALVHALTQVDPDRLQEEKLRGITIDLGYAYKPLPNGEVLGFVDVPGHEKFIHNMLAGATGIDYVLIAIAADDGPMPQTLEHLAILDRLGLNQGVVALTKVDLVDDARINQVKAEIKKILSNTSLAEADILSVSSHTGVGIAALDAHLAKVAVQKPPREPRGNFRLSVDRCFTLTGIGTIVTGTVFSGKVQVGDRVIVSPTGLEVRVRAIHAQNQVSETGLEGQRCALNVTAPHLEKKDIVRGDWVISPDIHAPTLRLDAELSILSTENKLFRHWSSVHVHLGACDVLGRIATLEDEAIAPGHKQLVQLVLDKPIASLAGDRFIIRDPSASRTIGGGVILDAFPAERGRRKPKRLAILNALKNAVIDTQEEMADPITAELEALIELMEINIDGVDLDWFKQILNMEQAVMDELILRSELLLVIADKKRVGFSKARWQILEATALAVIEQHHAMVSDSPGLTVDELRNKIDKSMAKSVMASIVEHLLLQKKLLRVGVRLACPSHTVKLSLNEQVLWERLYPILQANALMPPSVSEILSTLHMPELELRTLLDRLVRMGYLFKVRAEQYFLAEAIAQLGKQVEVLALEKAPERFTVGQLREFTHLARGVSIPLLELYDRIGLTVRYNSGRRLKRDWQSVFGEPENVR